MRKKVDFTKNIAKSKIIALTLYNLIHELWYDKNDIDKHKRQVFSPI